MINLLFISSVLKCSKSVLKFWYICIIRIVLIREILLAAVLCWVKAVKKFWDKKD